MSRETQDFVEPDRLPGAPHPREQGVLFGHAESERAFVDAICAGRLHHAWLIGGPQGVGKATLAYRVARRLLHQRADPHRPVADLSVPPDAAAARQVAALSHPDLAVLRRMPGSDRKGPSSTIPVDAVRRALAVFGATAAGGGYRICIVDSAEDLTISSANALLKVIEEPPANSLFLIVSHAPQRLLPTLRSRCRRLQLRPLQDGDVRLAVESVGPPWSTAQEGALLEAIELGEGSVRRTLEFLDPDKLTFIAGILQALDALPAYEPKRS